jgi:hypothetical protein
MKSVSLITFGLLFAVLFLSGCKDKEPAPCTDPTNSLCPNYDPCYRQKIPVTAEFDFMGYDGAVYPGGSNVILSGIPTYQGFTKQLDKDTIRFASSDTLFPVDVIFKARDASVESYEWRIGTDPRTWTTRKFSLSFPCEDLGGLPKQIPITLITRRLKDTTCGVAKQVLQDTFTKILYFIREMEKPLWMGKFRGAMVSNPSVIYDIDLSLTPTNLPDNDPCSFPYFYTVGPFNDTRSRDLIIKNWFNTGHIDTLQSIGNPTRWQYSYMFNESTQCNTLNNRALPGRPQNSYAQPWRIYIWVDPKTRLFHFKVLIFSAERRFTQPSQVEFRWYEFVGRPI